MVVAVVALEPGLVHVRVDMDVGRALVLVFVFVLDVVVIVLSVRVRVHGLIVEVFMGVGCVVVVLSVVQGRSSRRRIRGVSRAVAHEREVAGPDLEAIPVAELPGQGVERRDGHVDDGAALLAHEVLVGPAEVVDGGTVAQVRVLDDAEILEQAERPVHGRGVDVRVRLVHRVGDLLGGEMTFGADQRAQHGTPGRGDPEPPPTQLGDEVLFHPRPRLPSRRSQWTGRSVDSCERFAVDYGLHLGWTTGERAHAHP